MKRITFFGLLVTLSSLLVITSILASLRLRPSNAYRVAYLSFENNAVTIHVMNPDGTNQRTFTPRENFVFKNGPSWSPGANEIAYVKSDSQDFRSELWRVDIFANEVPIYLGDSVRDGTEPVWSPDGDWIVYGVRHPTRQHLQLLNVTTGATRILTSPADFAFHYIPRWSPDGQRLAFIAFQTGEQAIHLINRDGSGLKNISSAVNYRGTNLRELQWSPDGKWIAFVGMADGTASLNIYLLRSDGEDFRQMPSVNGQPANVRWSPDNQWLLFTVLFGDEIVYRMRIEDGLTESLPIAANPNQPVTWSPDGDWIYYTRLSDNTSPDIYRSHPDASDEQQLTDSLLPEFAPEPSPLVDRDWHLWLHSLIIGLGFVTLGRGVYARSRLSGRTGSQSRQ